MSGSSGTKDAIKEEALLIGKESLRFINKTIDVANIGMDLGSKAAKQIGNVSIDGSTKVAEESFILGKSSLILSGEISKDVFRGTKEIAKVAFNGSGEIMKVVFNGSSEFIVKVFGALNYTASEIGNQVKKYIDSSGDITNYIEKHGYDDILKKQLRNKFLYSTDLIIRIIKGVLYDLNNQLEFILNKFIVSIDCRYRLVYFIKCPETTSYTHIKDIESKIKEVREYLVSYMNELIKRVTSTKITCMFKIQGRHYNKDSVVELLNYLDAEINNMFNISELYDTYNKQISSLNEAIHQKRIGLESIKTNVDDKTVNQNQNKTKLLEQTHNYTKKMDDLIENQLDPAKIMKKENYTTEGPDIILPTSDTPVEEDKTPVGGRKSRRKKHRKIQAKYPVGKKMKTYRKKRRNGFFS